MKKGSVSSGSWSFSYQPIIAILLSPAVLFSGIDGCSTGVGHGQGNGTSGLIIRDMINNPTDTGKNQRSIG